MDLKRRIVDELAAGRARSLDLLEPLAPDDLVRQHSPLMSPLVWDLAHVGNYEELWLLRAVGADGVGPAPRRHLRRVPPPAPGPAGARPARPGPRTGRYLDRRAPAGASTCSTPSSSTPRRPAARATASSTAWSCSTSTSTTRRCWPRSS